MPLMRTVVPGASWVARARIWPAAPNWTTSMVETPSVTVASMRAGARPERVRRDDARTIWAWIVACSPLTSVRMSVRSPQVS